MCYNDGVIAEILLLSVCALAAPDARAFAFTSPTLDALQAEASLDPSAAASPELARNLASSRFSGEPVKSSAGPVRTMAGEGAPEPRKGPSYHFEGNSPFPGVTIYTPKLSSPGDEDTDTGKPPKNKVSWIPKTLVGGGLALAVAGIWFTPLLFLGGLLVGAGAVLWYLSAKYGVDPGRKP